MGYYTLSSFQIKTYDADCEVKCRYTYTTEWDAGNGCYSTKITFILYTQIIPPASSTTPSEYNVQFNNSGKNSKFKYVITEGKTIKASETVTYETGFNIIQHGGEGIIERCTKSVSSIKHEGALKIQIGFYWSLNPDLPVVTGLENSCNSSGTFIGESHTGTISVQTPTIIFPNISLNLQTTAFQLTGSGLNESLKFKWSKASQAAGNNQVVATISSVKLYIKKGSTEIGVQTLGATPPSAYLDLDGSISNKILNYGVGNYTAELKVGFSNSSTKKTATCSFTVSKPAVSAPDVVDGDITIVAKGPIFNGNIFDLSGRKSDNLDTAPSFYYDAVPYEIHITKRSDDNNKLTKFTLNNNKTYNLTLTTDTGGNTFYTSGNIYLESSSLSFIIYNSMGGSKTLENAITLNNFKEVGIDSSAISYETGDNNKITVTGLNNAIKHWGWYNWDGNNNSIPHITTTDGTITYTCRTRLVLELMVQVIGTDGETYSYLGKWAKTFESDKNNCKTIGGIAANEKNDTTGTTKIPASADFYCNFNFPQGVSASATGSKVALRTYIQAVRGNQNLSTATGDDSIASPQPSDKTKINITVNDKLGEQQVGSDPVPITGTLLVKTRLAYALKTDEGTLDEIPIFDYGKTNIKFNVPAYFDSFFYKSSKVLWKNENGNRLGTGTENIITFSQPVDQQTNGIVLVFSRMDGNAAGNWGWQSFFVPKQVVAQHPNGGHIFELKSVVNDGGNSINLVKGYKYIYIGNSSLTGQRNYNGNWVSVNMKSSPPSYQNDLFTLRYVLGV